MKLNDTDLKMLSQRIDKYHEIRNQADPGSLRILVNGHEHCSLTPASMKRVNLELDDRADMIEVRTSPEEGNILLATHYIDYPTLLAAEEPLEYAMKLKGGQKVSFLVSPAEMEADETLHFNLGVVYRETSPLRAAKLEWRRTAHALQNAGWASFLPQPALMRFALPALLLILSASGMWFLFEQNDLQDEGIIAMSQTVDKDITPAIVQPEVVSAIEQPVKHNRITSGAAAQARPAETPAQSSWINSVLDKDLTTRGVDVSASQPGIRSIRVRISDQTAEGSELVRKIEAALKDSARWSIAAADQADSFVTLKIDVENNELLVKLIDKDNTIIWPVAGKEPRRYTGSWEDVAKDIVADLTKDATGK